MGIPEAPCFICKHPLGFHKRKSCRWPDCICNRFEMIPGCYKCNSQYDYGGKTKQRCPIEQGNACICKCHK